MRARYLVAAVLALVIAVAWLGVVLADNAASAARDPEIPLTLFSEAEAEAHIFWDNPFQRMLYLRLSAVEIDEAGSDCPAITVNAYSLFGISVDQVRVDCEGVGRGGAAASAPPPTTMGSVVNRARHSGKPVITATP